MYWTLAARHLLVRPGRAAVLLIGYALGVAVMIVLLSIGDAMLNQSRDVTLVGGGELTALPHGVDIEAMRTGGLAGMFFGINGARFVSREMLGGKRQTGIIAAVSPELEQKLLEVRVHDTTWTVRAGADIPSMANAAGTGLQLVGGQWRDVAVDTAWRAPARQTLYDEMDHFHRAISGDTSWAEWHYFNVVISDREWWYITLLAAGDPREARSGGQVLLTHRQPDGRYQRFVSTVSRDSVHIDTVRADVRIGAAIVEQRDGIYHVRGAATGATFELTISPRTGSYFPPVELGDDHAASGYVVPALVASATGRICAGPVCQQLRNVPAYHDHNWGSWRAVTWEWGAAQGTGHAMLYGGVLNAGRRSSGVPFFLALEDSLGVRQIYRFSAVERFGARNVSGEPGIVAPDSMRIVATQGDDVLTLTVRIGDVAASRSMAAGPDRVFLQMRGTWTARGTAAKAIVADSGSGFFETWVTVGIRH